MLRDFWRTCFLRFRGRLFYLCNFIGSWTWVRKFNVTIELLTSLKNMWKGWGFREPVHHLSSGFLNQCVIGNLERELNFDFRLLSEDSKYAELLLLSKGQLQTQCQTAVTTVNCWKCRGTVNRRVGWKIYGCQLWLINRTKCVTGIFFCSIWACF